VRPPWPEANRPQPHPILSRGVLLGTVRTLTVRGGIPACLVVILALVALAPTAEAQTRPAIQVNVAAAPSSDIVRQSGGELTFTFTVSFRCLGTGAEYGACTGQLGDQTMHVTFEEDRAPYPKGWRVQMDTRAVILKARETHQVVAKVKLLQDEPERDRFAIGLVARAQPMSGSPLDPILGGQLGQSSTHGTSVQADKILNFGEQLTSYARQFMWPLLGAAVLLLVAGAVLVERRRGALGLESSAPSQAVVAGRGASFPIEVHNGTKADDRVQLSLVGLPPDWHAVVPLNEIDLRADERTRMWVTVRAPPDAVSGQVVNFALRARPMRSGHRDAELPLQATLTGHFAPVPTPPPVPPVDMEADAPAAAPVPQPRPRRRR
jgi:hypothetical protein